MYIIYGKEVEGWRANTSDGDVSNGVELQHGTGSDQLGFPGCQISLDLLAFDDAGFDLSSNLNISLDFFVYLLSPT